MICRTKASAAPLSSILNQRAQYLFHYSRSLRRPKMCQASVSRTCPAGPRGTPSYAVRLVLDFDGTLTKKDTMHIVAEAGYARQRRFHRDPQPQPWADVVDAYMSDLKAHTDAYLPKAVNRNTVAQEVAWLSSLRPIEDASIERAIQAGIFDQVSAADIIIAANEALDSGDVKLRDGWVELLSAIEQYNATLSECCMLDQTIQVISVNWSASFVRQTLYGCIQRLSDVEDQTKLRWLKDFRVYANEIPSLLGAGRQEPSDFDPMPHQHGGIRTSQDKASVLNSLRCRTQTGASAVIIYIGDSLTDLECLLAADIGICIRDQPIGSGQNDLAATCKRLGIEVVHVQAGSDPTPIHVRRIFWARGFHEVRQWFEEYHESLKHSRLHTD